MRLLNVHECSVEPRLSCQGNKHNHAFESSCPVANKENYFIIAVGTVFVGFFALWAETPEKRLRS